MGRPREHDDETRAALRAATERIVSESGVGAFSVRGVAREVGTTTRAVYSLFGSKEGLLVDAMAQTAYAFLADGRTYCRRRGIVRSKRRSTWPMPSGPSSEATTSTTTWYRVEVERSCRCASVRTVVSGQAMA